jgi:hypothetical protein
MKSILSVLFTLVFLSQFVICQMTERDTVFNRFRSVNIQNKRSISLQSSIDNIKDAVIKSSYDHYYLKQGSFIRADSVDIEVNNNNLVVAITFFYDTTYNSIKILYDKPLGTGKEFFFSSEAFSLKATKWEDKLTVFELIEFASNGQVQVYSVIFDKALFLGKYKNCAGAFNTDYPGELLRRFFRI